MKLKSIFRGWLYDQSPVARQGGLFDYDKRLAGEIVARGLRELGLDEEDLVKLKKSA